MDLDQWLHKDIAVIIGNFTHKGILMNSNNIGIFVKFKEGLEFIPFSSGVRVRLIE